MSYVGEGVKELEQKSLRDIQIETAHKWAGRACAAMVLGRPIEEAAEYGHEAIEHAALSGDDGVLAAVRALLAEYSVPV